MLEPDGLYPDAVLEQRFMAAQVRVVLREVRMAPGRPQRQMR